MFQWVVFTVIAVIGIGCSSNKKIEASAPATEATATATKAVTESKAAAHVEKVAKSATAKTSAATTGSKVECAVKGDTRVLEIRGKGNGCELGYTKGGQEGIVASGSNGSSHCEKTMAKIKERLQGSGFTCQ